MLDPSETQAFLLWELKKFTANDYTSGMKISASAFLANLDQSSCTSRSEADLSVKVEELNKKYKRSEDQLVKQKLLNVELRSKIDDILAEHEQNQKAINSKNGNTVTSICLPK